MRSPLLAVLLLASAPACSEPSEPRGSTTFTPAELSLFAELRTNGGTAQVLVTLLGDGTSVTLENPDRLSLEAPGGPAQTLVPGGFGYVAQLETTATEFDLVFSRGSERFVSKLVAPPPFSIVVPSATASRASPISIHWDAADGTFETWLDVTAPCLSWPISRYFVEDPGVYAIQPADLAIEPGTMDCDFRVWVTRSASSGTIAPGLGAAPAPGGMQTRSILIPTSP
ncbi:hypothetical protein [Polyangium jinanense]|uniref:Fibronectin type-III domain-containing protein n=1 Tax=Polyangium jinanense TaxID=2829994 RepID=A0A9X4AT48_9BACT|nr:hypothetical protein [Polyangium jinanense]MDC3954197.1 hypothetical protein [Polyangium jinanense]MDC3981847.1 hypothetical protein [Polyangium jinanense]